MISDPKLHYLPLLSATLKHAFTSTSYYKEVLSGYESGLVRLEDFLDVPLLTRAIIAERDNEMVTRDRVPDFLGNTSGTTFGQLARNPLTTFHSNDEVALARHVASIASKSSSTVQPLMLRVLSMDHGIDMLGGIPGVFPVPLVGKAHVAYIRHLLKKRFFFDGYSQRIRGLVGTLTRIKALTLLFHEMGDHQADFEIGYVGCHSQLLTDRWRSLLESFWGVAPTEIYGISEIPGLIGSRCEVCGHYHLTPTAYIETVDPDTYTPVQSGVAKLVATGLYPLVSVQPMIRYDTEDLVTVEAPCPATWQPALEYVGRSSVVVYRRFLGKAQLLINPMKLHNVIDAEPDIAIQQSKTALALGSKGVGFSKYRLSSKVDEERFQIHISAELHWLPILYPERAHELKQRLREKLIALSPSLRQGIMLGDGDLIIELLPPDSLHEFTEA